MYWCEGTLAGLVHTAEAAGEVVLCAGAVGSPHLLMSSGIGPADALRAHGIEVAVDLPGVGANLSGHPRGVVIYSAAKPVPVGVNNHGEVLAALRSDPVLSVPDLHVLFVAVPLTPPSMQGPESGFSINFSVLAPCSRGSVTLASADPEVAPVIDPGLLGDERDVLGVLAGLRVARDIGGSSALSGWRGEEVLPGAGADDAEELRAFLSQSVGSYWHPVGTCRMGTDAATVVDLDLRVHGIDGLRVLDASVMPSLPGANTNAATLAIAERGVDIIITNKATAR